MTNTKFSLKVLILFVFSCIAFETNLQAQEEKTPKKEWTSNNDMLRDAPVKQEESVYLVLNAKTTMEMLHTAKGEFKKRGGSFNYSNINFTEEGLLDQVKIAIMASSGKKVQKVWNREGEDLGEKIVVALSHRPTGSLVSIEQGALDYGNTISNKLFKKFVGLVVLSKDEEVFLKGVYAISADTDLSIGVNSKMKLTEGN